jgi:hypothetical protein
MKRKMLFLALVLCLAGTFSVSAYSAAVGGEFAVNLGSSGLPGSSAFVSFRVPKYPCVFGVGGSVNNSSFNFGAMADWWLAQGNLASFINYYVGPGVFADASSSSFSAGLRVPIGLNAFPLKPLELFIEAAPSFTVVSSSGLGLNWAGFQTGFGFRFWF